MANDNYFDEDEYETNKPEDGGDYVELYSKTAIWAFSIFFGVIFGGVLLMLNLRNAGYKKAGVIVLLFSIGFNIMAFIISYYVGLGRYSGLIFSIAGGAILTEYFFKKYFPENDYYPRPVWGALAVSVIIVLAVSFLVLQVPGVREQLELQMK
ncbi:MAG: hypothetical protein EOP46_10125 [Sphingobacteriaceae bacterium]|nr:MAG: hypothetical protein EOP46_10125 [Sphingobacteriaceae bacterium]